MYNTEFDCNSGDFDEEKQEASQNLSADSWQRSGLSKVSKKSESEPNQTSQSKKAVPENRSDKEASLLNPYSYYGQTAKPIFNLPLQKQWKIEDWNKGCNKPEFNKLGTQIDGPAPFGSPFQRLRFGEKIEFQRSTEEIDTAVFSNQSLTEPLKQRLREKLIQTSESSELTSDYKREFVNGLYGFAKRSDISNDEKAKTFQNIIEIMEADKGQPFSQIDREKLATQLLWHLSNVEKNCQGGNQTCNMTVIRGIMLYESPSKFSGFIRDLVQTGKFVTKDQSEISLPLESTKVTAQSEESKFPPADGSRTWLGKISDVAMANVYWQRQTKQLDDTRVRKGELVYREDIGNARLFRMTNGKPEPLQHETEQASNPGTSDRAIADIHQQITGESRENLVLTSNRVEVTTGPGVRTVDESQLQEILSREKGIHIARIWTGVDWVSKNSGQGVNGGEHVVLIKDYDPASKALAVDNSWSQDFDRLHPDSRISLHELFQAMDKQGMSTKHNLFSRMSNIDYAGTFNLTVDALAIPAALTANRFGSSRGMLSGYGLVRLTNDLSDIRRLRDSNDLTRVGLGITSDTMMITAGFAPRALPARFRAPLALGGAIMRGTLDYFYFGK